MGDGKEIEHKYLGPVGDWRPSGNGTDIAQAYLAIPSTGGGSFAYVINDSGGSHLVLGRRHNGRPIPELAIKLDEAALAELEPHLTDVTAGSSETNARTVKVPSGFEARVRIKNGQKAQFAIKSGSGLERVEIEFGIELDHARQLFGNRIGSVIEKTRYKETLPGGLVAEVDFYRGDNEGHSQIEVEVPTADTEVPVQEWFGEEVTGQDRFSNVELALHPIGRSEGGQAFTAGAAL